jgi:hypothetical protein
MSCPFSYIKACEDCNLFVEERVCVFIAILDRLDQATQLLSNDNEEALKLKKHEEIKKVVEQMKKVQAEKGYGDDLAFGPDPYINE